MIQMALGNSVPDWDDRLLKASEVQSQLGLSRAKVYQLMQRNILPTVRIGGSVRVPLKALKRWIAENTNPGSSRQPTDFWLTSRH